MRLKHRLVDPGCVFCVRIDKGDYDRLLSDKYAVAFKPLGPVVPGHLLVVSRDHVGDFARAPWITARTMRLAAEIARNHSTYDSVNLITSRGPAATQSIYHLHVHLVPRQWDDGLQLPWSSR